MASANEPSPPFPLMPRAETLRAANVNPRTGLATDFLNPFNEYVMLAETVADGAMPPGCLAEWQPVGYEGHFAGAGFAGTPIVLAAYRGLALSFRVQFGAAIEALIDAIAAHQASPEADRRLLDVVEARRDDVAQMISGEDVAVHDPIDADNCQNAIDALFEQGHNCGMSRAPNAVSVAVFSGADVLLIQRARAPYKGYWTLPGGRLEPGERPEEAARREIAEELGLRLDTLTEVLVFDPGQRGYRLAVFATRLGAGLVAPSEEVADWQWRAVGAIGDLRTTPGLDRVLGQAQRAILR